MARAREALSARVVGVGIDERAALSIGEGQFLVQTGAPGRAVFLYFLDLNPMDAPLLVGTPLSLAQVWRARLENGSSGPWPPERETLALTLLSVDVGVVTVP